MSKLKCPFCQQKLDYDDLLCSCINEHCEESFDMVGTELLWQKVIDLKQEIDRTRKALDVATGFIKGISQTAINDCDNQYVVLGNFKKFAQDTLDEITTLEQKG